MTLLDFLKTNPLRRVFDQIFWIWPFGKYSYYGKTKYNIHPDSKCKEMKPPLTWWFTFHLNLEIISQSVINRVSFAINLYFLCSFVPLFLCCNEYCSSLQKWRNTRLWMRAAGRYENPGPKHGWNKNTCKPLCCEDMYAKYFLICRCGVF